MATNLIIRSELLQPLGALNAVQRGAATYYRELKSSPDEFVRVGAWCTLLDNRLVTPAMWDELSVACRNESVRVRAFTLLLDSHEQERARDVLSTKAGSIDAAQSNLMRAELEHDSAAAARAEGELYLATGEIGRLEKASRKAEAVEGWRGAVAWAVRAVAIAPLNPVPVQRLYTVLESSGQAEILDEVASIFIARNLHLPVAQVFAASAAMTRGDAAGCLAKLRALDDGKVAANPALLAYLGHIRALRASAEEKLGHYTAAYEAYVALNAADRAKDINPEDFFRGLTARGKLPIPPLPRDTRSDVVQMTGFPRSGTTLLENALSAHPAIETFEETDALYVAIDRIERAIMANGSQDIPADAYVAARAKYYDEIDLLRRKANARVLVDKMPIRAADSAFLAKVFPDWRYIFSIRHPYDVVLSCFKQRFVPNPAMENFRTIDAAARAYDVSMTEWFKFHGMDDENVHYVRYDELVTNFEPVMRGALGFVGVEWDDAVLDFSKSAEKRAAVTPSYHKVRQGLSIGVQTQWQNYRFAFQSDATRPLRKWAEFFGYHVE